MLTRKTYFRCILIMHFYFDSVSSEKFREFIFIGYKMEQYELCIDLLMMCCICPPRLRTANDFQKNFKLKKLEAAGAEFHELLLILTVLQYVELE